MQKRFTPDAGGVFPEWEEKTLGECMTLIASKGYKGKDLVNDEDKAIMFSPSDIDTFGVVSLVKNAHISDELFKKSKEALVKNGDILFTKTASIGKVGYVKNLDHNATINPQIVILRANENVDSYLLFCAVRTESFKKQVRKISGGTTIKTMSQETLKELKIKIPKSIEEQRKIAAALAAYDEMIAVKTAKLETWQECKKRMVKEIFGRTKRVKDDDGNEFPEWEEKTLGEVAEILKNNVNPQDNKNDSFTEYSMPAYDNEQTAEVRLGAAMKSSRKKMTKPVVLVNKLNVRKKRVWKVSNPENNAVCSAEFVPLASDDMDLDFLQQLCETDDFTKYLIKNTTGTANSLQRVRPEVITNYTFKMPCMKEQQKIGSFLAEIDKEIQIQKEFIKTYAEGKKRMMMELME